MKLLEFEEKSKIVLMYSTLDGILESFDFEHVQYSESSLSEIENAQIWNWNISVPYSKS